MRIVYVSENGEGDFGISKFAANILGLENPEDFNRYDKKENEKLAALIEKYGSKKVSVGLELAIAEIPDEATDWWFDSYEIYESVYTAERIYCVLNGKRKRIATPSRSTLESPR